MGSSSVQSLATDTIYLLGEPPVLGRVHLYIHIGYVVLVFLKPYAVSVTGRSNINMTTYHAEIIMNSFRRVMRE